jgi:hypothetical protein
VLCLVELRGFEPLTPCMPCSFGLIFHPRSGMGTLPNHSLGVTVTVRWLPLDRCLWHAGGTAGENDNRSRVAATAPSSTGG